MDDDPRLWNEALRDQARAVVRAVGPDGPRHVIRLLEGHDWAGPDGCPGRLSRSTLCRWVRAELGGHHG